MKKAFPEVNVVYYEGGVFPFQDESFDISFSNAVIEHVGSRMNQQEFLEEALRVSKNIYITTPNRWFPLEAHTLIPFLHWLPKKVFRKVLIAVGLKYWAKEENLNLLDPLSVQRMVRVAGDENVKVKWSLFNPNIIIYKKP